MIKCWWQFLFTTKSSHKFWHLVFSFTSFSQILDHPQCFHLSLCYNTPPDHKYIQFRTSAWSIGWNFDHQFTIITFRVQLNWRKLLIVLLRESPQHLLHSIELQNLSLRWEAPASVYIVPQCSLIFSFQSVSSVCSTEIDIVDQLWLIFSS